MKFLGFGLKGGGQCVEDGVKFFQLQQRRYAHRGGKNVIGGLAVIYVVIGMDSVFAQLAAHVFRSAIRDDLIGVHVEANAGAGLKHVHNKRGVPLAVNHFFGRLHDCVSTFVIDQAKLFIGLRGGVFHHANSTNQRGVCAHAGDGIIFDGARSLHAVIHVSGNFLDADRIFFLAKLLASCSSL